MGDLHLAGLVLLGVTVLVAASTQRVTGLGFALVASPFLVLLTDAFTGIALANALSLVTNLLVLAQTWRDVELRRALVLAVPALLAVVPGAWVARTLPAPVLAVAVGGVVLLALVLVVAMPPVRAMGGTRGAVTAGALSGFMNVTAGVGGPAVSLYALATRWPHVAFVATAQLYFALLNAGSLAAKGLPDVSANTWAVALTALAGGVVLGHVAHRRVAPVQARRLVVLLAVVGSAATVVKGLLEL